MNKDQFMSVFDTPSWTIKWEASARVPSPQTTHHQLSGLLSPRPRDEAVSEMIVSCDLTVKLPPRASLVTGEIWRADISWHHTRWWADHTAQGLINWASGHRDPVYDGEYLGTEWESYDAKVQANLWEYWARRRPNTFINYRSDGLKIWPINTNLNFVRKTWVGNGFLLYKIQHVQP